MSEVSVVGQIIRSTISFAIAAAVIGTLGDLVFHTQKKVSVAIKSGGVSYGEWNRKLHRSDSAAPKNGGR